MKFVKYFSEFGWQPTVITVDGRDDIPHDETLMRHIPEDVNVYRTKAWGSPKLRIITEADISSGVSGMDDDHKVMKYLRMKRDLKNTINNFISIPDPLIYWVPSVISKTHQLHKIMPFDVLITTSPPHSIHFAGLFLSRRLGIPWIADFRDPWVDNVYFDRFKGLVRRQVETFFERLIITRANCVIANTAQNRDALLNRYNSLLAEARIKTITNGFDKAFIDSINPQDHDKFTICHTGVFYSLLEPGFFFESLSKWLKSKPATTRESLQVLLVGTSESGLKPVVEKLGLKDCVHFIPRVSHEKALSYAKSADLLLVNLGLEDNKKTRGWIPLKLYDYLGCDRPILAIVPEDGAASRLIRRTGTGYVISVSSHKAVCDVLENQFSLFMDKGAQKRICRNISHIQEYDIRLLTKKLADILDSSSKSSSDY